MREMDLVFIEIKLKPILGNVIKGFPFQEIHVIKKSILIHLLKINSRSKSKKKKKEGSKSKSILKLVINDYV